MRNFSYNIPEKFKNHIEVVFLILIVSLYILFFLKRVIYPDISYDSINYHFYLGKNGMENFPFSFKHSEFYPLGMHSFNPIVEMFNYILYYVLGYRLGTLLSLASIVGLCILSYLVLKNVTGPFFISLLALLFVFPAFVINEGLFQVGTYYTDNVYACLAMLYVFLIFNLIKTTNIVKEYFLVLTLGLTAGLLITKPTNFIYIIPLSFVTAWVIFKNNKDSSCLKHWRIAKQALLYLGILSTSNFFWIINYHQSGNPIFPYYNEIFQSIYYPAINWKFNFGPVGIIDQLFFPYFAIKDPRILGEVKDIFPDLKLFLIYFFVLIYSAYAYFSKEKFNSHENILLFIFLTSFFLWQAQFGYTRYAIFLEALGGILCVIIANKIFTQRSGGYFLRTITIFVILVLAFQTVKIIGFNYKYDISWRPTPTLTDWKYTFISEKLFAKFTNLDKDAIAALKNTDMVIQCFSPSSAYFSTIKELEGLPMMNFDKCPNGDLTTNGNYKKERDKRILNYLIIKKKHGDTTLKFATVFRKNSVLAGKEEETCLKVFDDNRIKINKKFEINNFIGNSNETLILLTGEYKI